MDVVVSVDSTGDMSDEYTGGSGPLGADYTDTAASSHVVGVVWYMAGTKYKDEYVSSKVSTAVEDAY